MPKMSLKNYQKGFVAMTPKNNILLIFDMSRYNFVKFEEVKVLFYNVILWFKVLNGGLLS